jgi:hypothetical protein
MTAVRIALGPRISDARCGILAHILPEIFGCKFVAKASICLGAVISPPIFSLKDGAPVVRFSVYS